MSHCIICFKKCWIFHLKLTNSCCQCVFENFLIFISFLMEVGIGFRCWVICVMNVIDFPWFGSLVALGVCHCMPSVYKMSYWHSSSIFESYFMDTSYSHTWIHCYLHCTFGSVCIEFDIEAISPTFALRPPW